MLKGPIARSTLRTSVVLGSRLVVLALTLWLGARLLGPHAFGVFASATALAVLLGALATFGMHFLLLREVSRDAGRLSDVLAFALPFTLLCGAALLVIYLCCAMLLLGHATDSWLLFLKLGIAELLVQPLVLLAAMTHQAASRIAFSQALLVLPLALRLLVLLCIYFLQPADLLGAYAIGYLLASAAALAVATLTLGTPWPPFSSWHLPQWRDVQDAAGYAALNITAQGTAEVDKVLMSRLLAMDLAGIYSVAARVVGALTLPIIALMLSAMPRLFRAGLDDAGGADRLLRMSLWVALLYGACMAAALWVVAPWIEWIFGAQYKGVREVIAALVPAVPGMVLRVVIGSALMAYGRPWMRVGFELAGMVVMVVAAVLITPSAGVRGMATAVAVSEWSMTVMGLYFLARLRGSRESPGPL